MLKDRRGDQRGVNESQSKFLKEFGLYPKINPNPQHVKSSGAETGRKMENSNGTAPREKLNKLNNWWLAAQTTGRGVTSELEPRRTSEKPVAID
jgi:hypothetical protein